MSFSSWIFVLILAPFAVTYLLLIGNSVHDYNRARALGKMRRRP